MKRIFLFTLAFNLISYPLRAAVFVGNGATGSTFLKIPIASRATAMGSAFTGVFGDATAIEYNPAGLVGLKRADINVTYIQYLEDASLQSASIGFPFVLNPKKLSPFDDFGDANKVFVGLQYRGFKADDTARNNIGAKLGTFDISDQLFQLDLAYSPLSKMSFGLGGKIINSKIQNNSVSNVAFDLGALFKAAEKLSVGFSVLNLGPDKAFIDEADPLPTTTRLGASWEPTKMLGITADLSNGKDNIFQKAAGIEFKPARFVQLRGGVVQATELDFAGGLGVRFGNPLEEISSEKRDRKEKRKILDDLDIPEQNPVYKKNAAGETRPTIELGLDYAFRTHQDLGISHTITFKILY